MRRIQIVLPVAGLLLSTGAALAATGTGGTQAGAANPAATSQSARTGGGAASGPASGKFVTESEATKSCGASNVVWANSNTKVFHVQGDQYYGHTKHGAFMCKSAATASGFHQAGQTARKS